MDEFLLKEDVKLFCVTAKSFPNGIVEAFQTLENIRPEICERPFYGISYQNTKGNTIYKAAVAEAFEGEGKKYGLETFIITKGEYLTETLFDFMQHIDIIPNTFKKLLADYKLDNSFPCIEWYKSGK